MIIPAFHSGALSIAPVGTSPSDESAWTTIGNATVPGWSPCSRGVCAAEDGHDLSCDEASGWDGILPGPPVTSWQATTTFQVAPEARHAMFGPPDAARVLTSEHVPPGNVFVVPAEASTSGRTEIIGRADEYREFTPAEYAGVIARHVVRHGAAAALLEYLGEDPGPAPDDPLPSLWRLSGLTLIREDWLFTSTSRVVDLATEKV